MLVFYICIFVLKEKNSFSYPTHPILILMPSWSYHQYTCRPHLVPSIAARMPYCPYLVRALSHASPFCSSSLTQTLGHLRHRVGCRRLSQLAGRRALLHFFPSSSARPLPCCSPWPPKSPALSWLLTPWQARPSSTSHLSPSPSLSVESPWWPSSPPCSPSTHVELVASPYTGVYQSPLSTWTTALKLAQAATSPNRALALAASRYFSPRHECRRSPAIVPPRGLVVNHTCHLLVVMGNQRVSPHGVVFSRHRSA
jgi:hypothetical protein